MATRKYILVPEETFRQLQQMAAAGAVKPKQNKPENMDDLLNGEGSSYQKWVLSQQLKHRFANLKTDPLKILLKKDESAIPTVKTEPEDSIQKLDHDVIKVLPSHLHEAGTIILAKLRESPKISWDEIGTVSIEGSEIKGSNIADLLFGMLKQASFKPTGMLEFLKIVSELNIPLSMIGNPKQLGIVEKLRDDGSMPVLKANKRLINWMPYIDEAPEDSEDGLPQRRSKRQRRANLDE